MAAAAPPSPPPPPPSRGKALESQDIEYLNALLGDMTPKKLNVGPTSGLHHFSRIWARRFGSGASPPTRILLVGTREALRLWALPPSSSGKNKKKGGKQKQKQPLTFGHSYIIPIVYDAEELGDFNMVDMDMPDGTILLFLPGSQHRLAHFQLLSRNNATADLLGRGNYMIAGVGQRGATFTARPGSESAMSTLFLDLEDVDMAIEVSAGVNLLIARMRIEWRGDIGEFQSLVTVKSGGVLQLVNAALTVGYDSDRDDDDDDDDDDDSEDEDDDASEDDEQTRKGWYGGEFETGMLVVAEHEARIDAFATALGPSSRSALWLGGAAAARLTQCTFTETGRGCHSQAVDRFQASGPSILCGEHSAIAVSHASDLELNHCNFLFNRGHVVQFRNSFEARGIPSTMEWFGCGDGGEEYGNPIPARSAAEQEQAADKLVKMLADKSPRSSAQIREGRLQDWRAEESIRAAGVGSVRINGGYGVSNGSARFLNPKGAATSQSKIDLQIMEMYLRYDKDIVNKVKDGTLRAGKASELWIPLAEECLRLVRLQESLEQPEGARGERGKVQKGSEGEE